MKKLRSYFEEKFGDWAQHLTDEQIEDMIISFVGGKGGLQPLSANATEDTKEYWGGSDTTFLRFVGNEEKTSNIPKYDIEIEDVSFTEGLSTSKYNGKSKTIKRYKGTIVEDKLGNNKKGMHIREIYDEAFDVDGGMIIKNGHTVFVRGMSVKDISIKTEIISSPVRISDRIKTQVEGISGYDRFMIKEDVFENNWKKFFANADSKDKIESVYPTVNIDRDSSRGLVNVTINASCRAEGIDYPSLIFNSVMYNSAKRGIVKAEYA